MVEILETSKRIKHDFSTGPRYDPDCRRWIVDISYPDRKTRVRKRFRREREARRFWLTEQARIADATWKTSSSTSKIKSFGELLDAYAVAHQQDRSYKTWILEGIRFWKASIDPSTLVGQITPDRIDRIRNAYFATGVAPATVDRKLELLRAAFNLAIQRGLCRFNPISAVKLFRVNNEVLRYFVRDEHPRLIAAAKLGPAYLEPLVQLALHTGMRRQNLTDLRWDQVDLDRRFIRLVRTKSNRTITIPLDDTALAVLQQLRARAAGSPHVFPELQGAKGTKSFRKAWQTCLRRAGISNLRWHDLRGCYAAALAQAGVPINAIKELLGHADLRSTFRYAALAPEYLASQVKVLDRVLPKDCQSPATVSTKGPARASKASQKVRRVKSNRSNEKR